jgi:protein-disulfide isomerase
MRRLMSSIVATVTGAVMILLPFAASRAQDNDSELDILVKQYLAAHPDVVGDIIKDYVGKHPDVFKNVLTDTLKQQPASVAEPDTNVQPSVGADQSGIVKKNAAALFSSPHQITLGNPNGDVTLVEFFDYNCGYCKGALPAMLSLLDDDPKLKIVLKEWPILGPGSVEAAHVAVAVRMQNEQKYLEFHRKLLGDPGAANKEKAFAAAQSADLDLSRLQHDMDSDEVRTTLDENVTLARALGINGTPGYVIGGDVVAGAVGLDALKTQIASLRSHAN